MGTRADYYIGRGDKAEWLGSSAYDGYPSGQENTLLEATTSDAFRAAVTARISDDDGTAPDQGWPWPWENSHTTDYAYMFEDGSVWVSCYGHEWIRYAELVAHRKSEAAWEDWHEGGEEGEEPTRPRDLAAKAAEVPDMSDRQRVAWGKRSGVIIVGVKV